MVLEAPEARNRWYLWLVIALALGVRLLAAVVTTSWHFPSERQHWAYGYEIGRIAASLAEGHGFAWPAWSTEYPPGPTAWMAPVYPILVAGAFKLFGVYSESAAVALFVLQSILSAAGCAVLYLLGKRLYDARVGLLAALFLALYPPSIHFAVQKIWSTSLFVLLVLALMWVLLDGVDRANWRWGARLGAVVGFTVLVDPVVVGVVPFAFLWLYLRRRDYGRLTRSLAVAVVTSLLVITPWLVRNYIVFGRFVFVKSNFAHELYIGNAMPPPDAPHRAERVEEIEREHARLRRMNEGTANQAFLKLAIRSITSDPRLFLRRVGLRFARFWTFGTVSHGLGKVVVFLLFLPLVALAALGYLTTRDRRQVSLLLTFVLAFPIPYYLTVASHYRYRYPLDPLLMILAAHGLLVAWGRARAPR